MTGTARHILLIEDDPSHALLLKRWLERAGHAVILAPSGREARSLLLREDWDALLARLQQDGVIAGLYEQGLAALEPDEARATDPNTTAGAVLAGGSPVLESR